MLPFYILFFLQTNLFCSTIPSYPLASIIDLKLKVDAFKDNGHTKGEKKKDILALNYQKTKKSKPWTLETCSCPFLRYFCTLLWDGMIIWDENIVYLFNWEKKLFWINKKFVYLIFIKTLSWYHPKITYKNIVKKDMNKFKSCKLWFFLVIFWYWVTVFCQISWISTRGL